MNDFNEDTQMVPIHLAIKNRQLDILKLLVSYGANVNATNNSGRTPLYFLAEEWPNISEEDRDKYLECLNINAAAPKIFFKDSSDEMSPIEFAIRQGQECETLVKKLLLPTTAINEDIRKAMNVS